MDREKLLYEGDGPYIFVSYRHMDNESVIPVIRQLCERGYRVWYDADIVVGEDWSECIAEHLYNSNCVLVFMSNNYLDSKDCMKELKFAFKYGKKLLVVYLENVRLSYGLQMQMDDIQALHGSRFDGPRGLTDALCASEIIAACCDGPQKCDANKAEKQPNTDIWEELLRKGDSLFKAKEFGVAIEWYRKAAEQGYDKAQLALANCYYDGSGCKKDLITAVNWYRKAAQQNNAQALFALGRCYELGKGVSKNQSDAKDWYRKAAEQGYKEAQIALERYSANDNVVPMLDGQKITQYRKAAMEGDAQALYMLGDVYWGIQAHADAFALYSQAAQKGHALAQYRLGDCYYNGEGTAQQYDSAAAWYRKAAEQGNGDAQMALGVCYDRGRGVPENKEIAAQWFHSAAQQGNVRAQYKLGVYYNCGEGVLQSPEMAIYWFRKAAENGHVQAQYKLGYFYDKGRVVQQDSQEAERWYRAAAEQGYLRAEDNLQKLLKKKNGNEAAEEL